MDFADSLCCARGEFEPVGRRRAPQRVLNPLRFSNELRVVSVSDGLMRRGLWKVGSCSFEKSATRTLGPHLPDPRTHRRAGPLRHLDGKAISLPPPQLPPQPDQRQHADQ